MSYCIEYNRQFIKSNEGITPCVLRGDNNVYESSAQNAKRVRSWYCYKGMVGVTEQEMLDDAQPFLNRYNQHWKKNGKYVDDDGLIRWIKIGVKHAAPIEDILALNHMRSVHCSVSVYPRGSYDKSVQLDTRCSSTDEFDIWVRAVKFLQQEALKTGESIYPIVNFYIENLLHPVCCYAEHPQKVIFKHKGSYLCSYDDDGAQFNANVKMALEFSFDDAIKIKNHSRLSWIQKSQLINADIKNYPYNAVIRFCDGVRAGQYLLSRTKRTIRLSPDIKHAKKYKNMETAKRALAQVQPAVKHIGTLEAVEIDNEE